MVVLELEMEVELVFTLCSSFFLQILTSACESFLLDILETESSVQNEKIRMFISIDFLFFLAFKVFGADGTNIGIGFGITKCLAVLVSGKYDLSVHMLCLSVCLSVHLTAVMS